MEYKYVVIKMIFVRRWNHSEYDWVKFDLGLHAFFRVLSWIRCYALLNDMLSMLRACGVCGAQDEKYISLMGR